MTDTQCRICLEDIDPDDCGSSLFNKRLRLAMAGVFSFEIPFRRDLPMYTCKRCSWNVMDFHGYCKAVQKNQEKLEQKFNLDDEFEIDENLPTESNDTDDAKEEAASSTDCEASNSINPNVYDRIPGNMTDSQCRFCLEDIDPDDCGSSLFDKRLRLAMAGVFSFEIPFRRDLPMYTCERCSWIVMDFHDYCKAVQKNQEKLEQEFNLDDEFEIDENLPMESNDTDDSKEEAASSTDCEASNSIEPEYSADDNIHLSPVAITSAIMPDEDDDWEDDVEVAYEFNPDFESVNCEETSESEEQLSISSEEHKIPSSSEEAVKTLESEDSHATHNSVNASISNEEAPDPSFDQPETEPKKKCLIRSSRFTTQSKSSASSNNRVLERKHKSVGETSHHTPNTANAAEHVCDLCGKSFLCKSKLRQHARCHKFVECPVCKKTLIGRTLKVHIAAHEGAFRCDVCDKTCASKQNLELHKDTQYLVKTERNIHAISVTNRFSPRVIYETIKDIIS